MTATTQQVRRGGEVVVETLIREGVTTVFGLPGIQLDPLFDAFHGAADEIEVVVPRHEQATTYMADGYARVTGRPGVALVVPGPGVLNALSGMATAYACQSPVLLLAGQVASGHIATGHGVLHEIIDQTLVAEGVVRWVRRAEDPADIPGLIREAFAFMTGPTPGPAILELPADVLAQQVDTPAPVPAPPAARDEAVALAPVAPAADVRAAARLLAAARRPVIVAGGGAVGDASRPALQRLAERLGAPVVMSENGKGALPAGHALAFERTALAELRRTADAFLVVGSRLRSAGTGEVLPHPEAVVRIDTERWRAHEATEAGVALAGDAGTLLAELDEAVAACDAEAEASVTAERGFAAAELDAVRAEIGARLETIRPQLDYLAAIRGALPEGGVLLAEFTQLGYAASMTYPVEHPRQFIWPGYQGTLGYGFATALGAAVGSDTPVVCVSGDGGFSWTLPELSTAAKYGIPLTTIVVNDGHFGNVRRIQGELYGARYIGTDLHNPDYLMLAAAFGVPGVRVHDPAELGQAVRDAIAAGGPTLIELVASEFPSPWTIPLGD